MSSSGGVRCLILSTARTGTNLLIELLNSHPDCYVGYELFNDRDILNEHVAWYLDDDTPASAELCALRRADPVALIEKLQGLAFQRGFKVTGFKLMYFQAAEHPQVRDYLLRDSDIRVIHVKRHDLLRRFVSLRRAMASGHWRVVAGERFTLPPVALSLQEIAWDIADVRRSEQEYGVLDATHEVLHLTYEDMIVDLRATAHEVFRFLGLRPWDRLTVGTVKTGTGSLREAIANYDELKQQARELAALFAE